jgi:hypothetical protein
MEFNITTKGHPGNTTKATSAVDTVLTITPITGCVGALITVETQSIRYSFGTPPTNDAGTALGHIATAGTIITLTSGNAVKKFKYLNKVAGSNAELQITQFSNKAVAAP